MIKEFKRALGEFNDKTFVTAIAEVDFSFSKETLHPCLCVKHPKHGLISPLEGRTLATIAEIHLALRMGASITYISAVVIESKDGLLFRDHLKILIDERSKAKDNGDKLLDQLYKLYVNTLYGKTAQGITPKSSFNLRDRETKVLGYSPVSQAYIASMITGTLRAALSAVIFSTDELNAQGHDYLVISATTDGLLYRVSSKADVAFKDALKSPYHDDIPSALKSGDKIFERFENVDPILYNKLLEFPVLRLIQHSRELLGYDEYIEIKHAVNSVLNIKTRGQIGAYCV